MAIVRPYGTSRTAASGPAGPRTVGAGPARPGVAGQRDSSMTIDRANVCHDSVRRWPGSGGSTGGDTWERPPPCTEPRAHAEAANPVTHPLVGWVVLGWLGAMGMVLSGTRIGAVPDPHLALWWFSVPAGGSPVESVVFYVSVALLVGAWLGLGRLARAGQLTVGRAWIVLAVWGLPLVLGPPLFSRDLFSYVGQGLLAHHGLNPYTVAPSALGHGPLLSGIASVWRDTTSPYGPLFVALTKGAASVSGGSLAAQVVAFRALELVGVVLVMVSLPRLARHLGTDPGMALWLGALSPLCPVRLCGLRPQRRPDGRTAGGRGDAGRDRATGPGTGSLCPGGHGQAPGRRRSGVPGRRPDGTAVRCQAVAGAR